MIGDFQRYLGMCIIGMSLLTVMHAETLDAEYVWSNGDMAALQLNLFTQTAGKTLIEQHDAPLLVIYDESEGKMIFNMYASQNMLGAAQTAILQVTEFIADDCIPYLQNIYAIRLDMADVVIQYRNRNEEGMKVILIWENGEFIFPGTE
jgi:hypothetical protein